MGILIEMPLHEPVDNRRLCSQCWFALLSHTGAMPFCGLFNEPILDEADAVGCEGYRFDGIDQ